MMDYVSNKNGTIAREKGTDHASVLLAYDMLLTATRNNKKKSGKEKEKHGNYTRAVSNVNARIVHCCKISDQRTEGST